MALPSPHALVSLLNGKSQTLLLLPYFLTLLAISASLWAALWSLLRPQWGEP